MAVFRHAMVACCILMRANVLYLYEAEAVACRDSAGRTASNAKDTAMSKRGIRDILKARKKKSTKKRCIV